MKKTKKRITRSRASRKPSVKILDEIIKRHHGIVTYIADELNVTPMTCYKYINSSTILQQTLKDSRERQFDKGVHKLMDNVDAGKEPSIFYLLRCLGKEKGYDDRQNTNVQITNNNYKQINIIVQDNETKELLDGIVINQKLLNDGEQEG